MKKILLLLSLFVATDVFADACSVRLMPTFPAAQAKAICNNISGGTLTNPTVSGTLTFSTAASKIVPGATSFSIRNNANDNDNFACLNSGACSIRAGLRVYSGTVQSDVGDFVVAGSGGTLSLQEATAGSACSGTLTANGATPVVTSTTCALTGSRIFLTRTSAETGTVTAWISALSTGVSFSITSEAADTGTYNWFIIHESA